MALEQELERAGNWLFPRRSYLPALLLPIVLLAMTRHTDPLGSERLDIVWQAVCLLIGFVGLVVRAATIGFAPVNTSGNTQSQLADSLTTTGLYSVVRHPLYVGNYLLWLAVGAVPRVWWAPVLVSLIFWLYYERIMYAEEAYLRKRFGDAFESWASATPAFIPRLSLWQAADRPFSLRAVLRREYSALLALAVAFAALDLVGDLASTGRLSLDRCWLTFVAAAAVVSVALRELRRRTHLLDVPDR